MDIQTKDGILLRNIPDGTPDDEIKVRLAKIRSERDTSPKSPEVVTKPKGPEVVTNPTLGERVAGHEAVRAGLGALSIPVAAVQAGANIGDWIAEKTGLAGKFGGTKYVPTSSLPPGEQERVKKLPGMQELEPIKGHPNKIIAAIEEAKKRGMSYYSGKPVGESLDIAGGVGSLGAGIGITSGMKVAPSLLGRMAQGVGVSGAMGAATPDTSVSSPDAYFSDLADRAKISAALGGLIPLGVSTAGTVYDVGKGAAKTLSETIRNFTPSGQTKLAESHIAKLINKGGEPARAATEKALLDEASVGMTSADAIAKANIGKPNRFGGQIVRLQEELASLPETSTALRSSRVGQEFARKKSLEGLVGGAKADDLLAVRQAAAAKNYGTALKEAVTPDATLDDLLSRPAIKDVDNVVKDIMGNKKIPIVNPDGTVPMERLHLMKVAMDDILREPEKFPIGKTHAGSIKGVRNQLVKWMDDHSDAYKFAREQHKELSLPIDKATSRDKLLEILKGDDITEKKAQFLTAMRDLPKTFKKATGESRYSTLEDVFTPEEAKVIRQISDDLTRDQMTKRMVGEMNIPGATSPVTGNLSELPSPLYRPTMVANWILRSRGQEGNEAVNRIAAEILANPKNTAEIIKKVPKSTMDKITEAMMKNKENLFFPAVTGTALGYSRGQ